MNLINNGQKYSFYIALGLTCICMIINEFTATGMSHGPEDLPILLVFMFLCMNLLSLFLFNFKATKPFSYMITIVSIMLFLIIIFQIIAIS
jgi:hypothetical protein